MELSPAEIKDSLQEMKARMNKLCKELETDGGIPPQKLLIELESLDSILHTLVTLVARQTPSAPEKPLPVMERLNPRWIRS